MANEVEHTTLEVRVELGPSADHCRAS